MNYKGIIKTLAILACVASLQSCDKDFSEVGGDIIGDNNLNIDTYQVNDITAYTQPYGALGTKNLANMPFGSLDNGEFGRVNSSFVTQVLSSSTTFSAMKSTAVIDSVYVYIPYYAQFDKIENEATLYKLQNVTGDGTFNLEVYENGYYLNDVNPGTGKTLDYYSDASAQYEQFKNPTLLNDSRDVKQNTAFAFTTKNIIIYKRDEQGNIVKDETTGKLVEKEKLAPGLWLDLNKEHFNKFVKNNAHISDQSQFRNFFRGLYFKATGNNTAGALGLLNLAQGKLVIKYHQEIQETNTAGEVVKKIQRQIITLPFTKSGGDENAAALGEHINVSLQTNEGNQHTTAGNKTEGDALLYVKGGEGNVAVLDLFNKNDFEELKKLKDWDVLINDAILTVHIDESAMNKNQIPQRLYLYNYDNGLPISDFLNDNSANSEYTKLIFGGIYQTASEEGTKIKGNTYKFRISEYIRAILKNKELKSPKLAIAATYNYNEALLNTVNKGINSKLKTPLENTPENVTYVPSLSAIQPLGTVIHGTNTNSDKKMTLQIFYTKTKN